MWQPRPIPLVNPISIGNTFSTGRSLPRIMYCENDGKKIEYVVKLFCRLELGKHSLAREFLASDLAAFFDLRTPEIALVEITNEFAMSIQGSPYHSEYLSSVGLNFGSKYIPGAKIFSPPIVFTQIENSAMVFCFDLLLGNTDRRVNKANLFDDNDSFILFDHEQCFPYSRPGMLIGGYPPGSKFILEDWHRNHVLYSSLKGKTCTAFVQSFVDKLLKLDDNILSSMENRIPREWYSDDIKNILRYIIDIRENSELFMRSLQECFL